LHHKGKGLKKGADRLFLSCRKSRKPEGSNEVYHKEKTARQGTRPA